METRAAIALFISLILLFAYEEFVVKRLFPPPSKPSVAGKNYSSKPTPATGVPSSEALAPSTSSQPVFLSLTNSGQPVTLAQPTIEVDTPLYRCKLRSLGARVTSFELLDYRATSAPDSPPLDLVHRSANGQYPFGLILRKGSQLFDDSQLQYVSDRSSPVHIKSAGEEITFSAETVDGLKISKTFVFSPNNYAFQIKLRVQGRLTELNALGLTLSEQFTALEGYRNSLTAEAEVNGKTLVEAQSALAGGISPVVGTIAYAGFGDRYFLSVVMPRKPVEGTLEMGLSDGEGVTRLWFPVTAGQGEAEAQLLAYFGPKKLDVLESVDPKLRDSINFGWAAAIAVPFVHALNFFHYFAPNYGVDIILLTVAIRLLLLPVSLRSQRSMIKMQRLAPQIERLREKYKDDQERLNREMLDLYRRNHVNPLGGCLPTLLQLPIFIGLYEALLNAVELRHAPFILWIRDLSAPECLTIPHMPKLPFTDCNGIPVLVLLMGVSAYVQQKMAPQPVDPNQQRMMMWMPLVFTLLFLNFPSGLTLYYFFTNLLGIVQQYVLNREFKQLASVTQ